MTQVRLLSSAATAVIISIGSGVPAYAYAALCPYPQVAVYKGKGSTDDAANFVCRRTR